VGRRKRRGCGGGSRGVCRMSRLQQLIKIPIAARNKTLHANLLGLVDEYHCRGLVENTGGELMKGDGQARLLSLPLPLVPLLRDTTGLSNLLFHFQILTNLFLLLCVA
jgi:hypothetical protein